jgi:tetratricopeptide (TPR) repeat protein
LAGKRKVYEDAMRMAAEFMRNADWSSAVKAYRTALDSFPDTIEAWLGLSKAYLEAGRMQEAIESLQRAARANPDEFEAYLLLADAYERTGRLELAGDAFVSAGNILARQKRLDEAIDLWERTIGLVSDHLEAHNKLAQGFARLGQIERAVQQLIRLASIYQRQGDPRRAQQQLRGALHLAPGNRGAEIALAALQQGEAIPVAVTTRAPEAKVASSRPAAEADDLFFGDVEEEVGGDPSERAQQQALSELAEILFEDELDGVTGNKLEIDALVSQAIDLQTRGQNGAALEIYAQLNKKGLDRPSVYFNLGLLHYGESHVSQAVKALNVALEDVSYRLGAHYALGKIYYEQDDPSAAVGQFLEVVKLVDLQSLPPTHAQQLGQRYEQTAQTYAGAAGSDAREVFIRSLLSFFSTDNWPRRAREARRQMDSLAGDSSIRSLAEYLATPETPVALSAMARTAEYMGRNMWMTAAEECFNAIQRAPSYLPIHLRLAEILLRQEHAEEAIAKYLKVGDVYQVRGQPEQSIDVYRKVLALAPMDVTVRSRLIELLVGRGEFDETMEQYLALADAYYQLAQVNQSLEKYEEALRLAPQAEMPHIWQAEILHRMGDIYNQRVDWVRATTAYEELVKIKPDDERAKKALIDLYFKQGQADQGLAIIDNLQAQYQAKGDPKTMLTVLKEAKDTWPDEMGLRERLSLTYAQLGMKREAIAEYDVLGEMQLEQGLREEAARTIQKIIELGPDDPDGYRQLLGQIQ